MKLKNILNEVQFPFLKNYIKNHPEHEAKYLKSSESDWFELYAEELRDGIFKKFRTSRFDGWNIDFDYHGGSILFYHPDMEMHDPMPIETTKIRGKECHYLCVDFLGATPFWEGHKGIDVGGYVEWFGPDGAFVVQTDIDVPVYPKWTGDVKKDITLWEKGVKKAMKLFMKKIPKYDGSKPRISEL